MTSHRIIGSTGWEIQGGRTSFIFFLLTNRLFPQYAKGASVKIAIKYVASLIRKSSPLLGSPTTSIACFLASWGHSTLLRVLYVASISELGTNTSSETTGLFTRNFCTQIALHGAFCLILSGCSASLVSSYILGQRQTKKNE